MTVSPPVAAPAATLGRRVGAFAIDLGIAYAIGAVMAGILLGIVFAIVPFADPGALALMIGISSAGVGLVLIAWWLVYSAMQGGRGSIGQRALGVRLQDAGTGAPIGFWRAVWRNVVFGLAAYIVVGYFTPLFDGSGRHQGWHDKAARAVVVDAKRTDASPRAGSAVPATDVHLPSAAPTSAPVAYGAPHAAPAQGPASPAYAAYPPPAPPLAAPAAFGSPAAYAAAGAYAAPTAYAAPAAHAAHAAPPAPAPAYFAPAVHVAPDVHGAQPAPAAPPAYAAPAAWAASAAPTAYAAPAAPATPVAYGAPAAYAAPVAHAAPVAPAGPAAPAALSPAESLGTRVIEVVPWATGDPFPEHGAGAYAAAPAPAAVATAAPAPVVSPAMAAPTAPTMQPVMAFAGAAAAAPAASAFAPTAHGADVDATRTSVPPAAQRAALYDDAPVIAVLTWDDGVRMAVYGRTLYGRNPVTEPGVIPIAVRDETLSMSKTHFEIGGDATAAWIVDRHSTNGTTLVRDGARIPLFAGVRTTLRTGDVLELGDRRAAVGLAR